jgi:hypothetical protein
LDDEDISTTDRLLKSALNFAISEIDKSWVTQFYAQVLGDFFGKRGISSTGKEVQTLFGY